jgi:hypothetical protein
MVRNLPLSPTQAMKVMNLLKALLTCSVSQLL